jgi:Amidohydrolase family
MQKQLFWSLLAVIGSMCIPLRTAAQLKGDLPKVTSAYVLQNVNLVSSPGSLQENTNIFIEDGLIQVIGHNISIPAHARIVKCDSMFVYAGFIEGVSHTGIPPRAKDSKENGQKPKIDRGNPPNDVAGIRPGQSVRDLFKSSEKSVGNMRKLGFTASHVVPKDGMLPGKGSLVLLGEGETDKLILKEDLSLFLQLSPARRMYPGTVIGVMSKWRELYRQAEYLKKHKEAFDGESDGIGRPQYDRATEALFPVVSSDIPVYFKAPNALDAHKAFTLQDELGFEMTLVELKEGWHITDELTGRKTPVMISLDLPEDQSDEKKDKDSTEVDLEIEKMTQRRHESLLEHYRQAAVLSEAGIPISFSMLNVKSKDFRANALKMIENGLSPDVAIAALTTVPAKMLGVDKYLGTVSVGKMANLVISTGRYFAEKSQVRYVFVEGVLYEYDIKEKKEKKKSGGEPADVSGNWTFEVDIPGDEQSGTFNITGSDGDFQGKLTSDDDDEVTELDNIEVDGNTLTFSMNMEQDGGSMTIEFELTIDGESFSGEVIAGEFGTFPIEGDRIPKS